MIPDNVASLLLSMKVNQLGHLAIGLRGRWWTNVFLGLSAILSCVAGFTGLADIISKQWVSVISLAAAISTAVVIFFLTTLKSDAHLRAQAKYGDLYMQALTREMADADGARHVGGLWDEFRRTVNEVNSDGAPLKPRQIRKFARQARESLPSATMRQQAELLKTGDGESDVQ